MEQNVQTLKKEPKLQQVGYYPVWWHRYGDKVKLTKLNTMDKILRMDSTAVQIIIASQFENNMKWGLSWKVTQSRNEYAEGFVYFNDEQLRAAFAIEDVVSPGSEWLIEEYGGDSALQRKFIRWQQYLNIPAPGTGHDGDPNVSVFVDKDIFNAVQRLLSL